MADARDTDVAAVTWMHEAGHALAVEFFGGTWSFSRDADGNAQIEYTLPPRPGNLMAHAIIAWAGPMACGNDRAVHELSDVDAVAVLDYCEAMGDDDPVNALTSDYSMRCAVIAGQIIEAQRARLHDIALDIARRDGGLRLV